eukprot:SAG31_NODE_3211_length_4548_cov_3.394695_6_plen_57_part_00
MSVVLGATTNNGIGCCGKNKINNKINKYIYIYIAANILEIIGVLVARVSQFGTSTL